MRCDIREQHGKDDGRILTSKPTGRRPLKPLILVVRGRYTISSDMRMLLMCVHGLVAEERRFPLHSDLMGREIHGDAARAVDDLFALVCDHDPCLLL